MANPNIVNVQTIRGMTTVRRYVKKESIPILTNSASSQQILKVNSLYLTHNNANQRATVNVTLTLTTSGGTVPLVNNISIPVNATFVPMEGSRSIYVGEGESLNIRASSNDRIGVVCSYEQISDSSVSDRNDDITETLSPVTVGQAIYSTPGTYSWVAPTGITSVCVVCVGGGGAGDDGNGGDGGGGGGSGGGLVYANFIPVTPGSSYTVVVGAGGNNGNGKNARASNGGNTSFTVGSFVMTAIGGEGGAPYSTSPGSTGRSYTTVNVPLGVTIGGGTGGNGGAGYNGGGGGGGAAGYDGAGGVGSYSLTSSPAQNGIGYGSGGGGGPTTGGTGNGGGNGGTGQYDVTGGGGGGAALFSASYPTTNGGNGNSSTSSPSQGGAGGFPGGGGGGSWDNNTGVVANGGNGAVKIIWGENRSFPVAATDADDDVFPLSLTTNGLALHLDAADTSSYPGTGTTWFDKVGLTNGTLVNGVGYVNQNGGYLTFDGSNDGVQLAGTNLSLNQMTIISWNYATNYVQNGFMFEKTTNDSVNTQYSLFYNNDSGNHIYFRTYGLSTQDLSLSRAASGVIDSAWNQIVATYDGTSKKIYVNGQLKTTQSVTGTVTQNTTGKAYIGIYGGFAGYPFNGRISMTMLYNRALTQKEIIENYYIVKPRFDPVPINITTNIVLSGLIMYLDAGNPSSYTGSGSTWLDLSGYGNNMNLVNSPTYSSSNGGVLQFNGSNQYARSDLNYSTSTFTIIAGSRYSGSTRGRVITSVNNNWLFGHWQSGSDRYYAEGWVHQGSSNDTNWRIYAATENYPSDQRSFYVNNSAIVTNSTAGAQGFNGLQVGGWGTGISEASTCEVGFILVYNRILSTEEITQNYNAFRSRYGL